MKTIKQAMKVLVLLLVMGAGFNGFGFQDVQAEGNIPLPSDEVTPTNENDDFYE
ncbi:hypothetical protein [Sporosarcina sp. NPDC096371]|uniref:hypothetical protein n=1 Tax=Sporosarcina sp. NPDC096371 TaxID=3364530 RepID=UPI0038125DBC